MPEADYRLMTEATGQRIAAALEALSGTGAAAAAARANLDVYSTSEVDAAIQQRTAIYTKVTGISTGSIASLRSVTVEALTNIDATQYDCIAVTPMCGNGWCKPTLSFISTLNGKYIASINVYNGNSTEAREFSLDVLFAFTPNNHSVT